MFTIKNSSVVINYYNTYEEKKQVAQNDINIYAHSKKVTRDCTSHFVKYLRDTKEFAKADRVESCGSFLQFKYYHDLDVNSLHSINLCRERMCLNCQFNLARERARVLRKAITGKHIFFTTLTVENCRGGVLRDTLNKMISAQRKLFRHFKNNDYYRSIEVTYNKQDDTYHPHLHIIHLEELPLSPSRLNKTWRDFVVGDGIKCSREWLSCKQEIASDLNSTALEMSKYITKPTDIGEDTIPTLYTQCKGLHLHQARGYFKEQIKAITESADRVKAEEEQRLSAFDYEIYSYLWNGDNYIKCDLKSYNNEV
jgi:hypothetical protein